MHQLSQSLNISRKRTYSRPLLFIVILIFLQLLTSDINQTKESRNTPKSEFVWLGEIPQSCSFTARSSYWLIPSCSKYAAGMVIKAISRPIHNTANDIKSQKRLTAARVVPISDRDGSLLFWYSFLSQRMIQWRVQVFHSFWVWLGRNEGSLLFSFVFGGGQILEENTQNIIKQVGLSHMVAASGLQVGLLCYLVNLLPISGSIWHKKLLQLAIIWFYAWTALLAASILRAAVMASLATLAPIWLRKSSPLWYLVLAVLILIYWAPILAFSPGFQLSVMASLGLILQSNGWLSSLLVGSGLDSGQTHLPRGVWPRLKNYGHEALQMSMVAQIWTLPIVLYHFGQVSIWSVVSTALVSWLAVPLFNWGLMMAVFSSLTSISHLLKPLLFAIAFIPRVLTQMFISIASFLNATSQLSLRVTAFPLWAVFGWYLLLASLYFAGRHRTSRLTISHLSNSVC